MINIKVVVKDFCFFGATVCNDSLHNQCLLKRQSHKILLPIILIDRTDGYLRACLGPLLKGCSNSPKILFNQLFCLVFCSTHLAGVSSGEPLVELPCLPLAGEDNEEGDDKPHCFRPTHCPSCLKRETKKFNKRLARTDTSKVVQELQNTKQKS